MKARGTRDEVFAGLAAKTSGGLTRADLFKDIDGKIKSRKASAASKAKMKSGKGIFGSSLSSRQTQIGGQAGAPRAPARRVAAVADAGEQLSAFYERLGAAMPETQMRVLLSGFRRGRADPFTRFARDLHNTVAKVAKAFKPLTPQGQLAMAADFLDGLVMLGFTPAVAFALPARALQELVEQNVPPVGATFSQTMRHNSRMSERLSGKDGKKAREDLARQFGAVHSGVRKAGDEIERDRVRAEAKKEKEKSAAAKGAPESEKPSRGSGARGGLSGGGAVLAGAGSARGRMMAPRPQHVRK